MVFWKFLSTWSHAANLGDLVASNSFRLAKWKQEKWKFSWAVKVLENSMWRSYPSCIRAWSVLITFKSSKSSKEVHPGSIESFGYASLCCHRERKACTLSSLGFLPITVNSLDRWTSSSSVSRLYGAMVPLRHLFCNCTHNAETSQADHCRAPCCPHQIPRWLNDRCSRSGYKREPLARNRLSSTPPPSCSSSG
jgi:hypothetical protein